MLRDTRIAFRIARTRVATARPPSASETTQSPSLSLSDAWTVASPEHGRPVDVGRERLAAHRVVDHADRRDAVHDEAHRDAEERDPVRVVDGAVERVDDPGAPERARLPVPSGPRLPVRAGLLGEDPVAREPRPDRVDDQRLGQVVDLGHDVPRRLVVDLLHPLVALEQDPSRALGDLPRELEVGRKPARDRLGRHGGAVDVRASSASSRGWSRPRRTSPSPRAGRSGSGRTPSPARSRAAAGSPMRQVVAPAFEPALVT